MKLFFLGFFRVFYLVAGTCAITLIEVHPVAMGILVVLCFYASYRYDKFYAEAKAGQDYRDKLRREQVMLDDYERDAYHPESTNL